MTPEEAIEIIWERHMDFEDYFSRFDGCPDGYDFKLDQAILIAAQALEEIQQYWEIGTVEECREAVEKQKPKKRIYPKTALERYYHAPECPNCKRELKPRICGYTLSRAIGIYSYCPWCGQNLEGGEESEEE